MDLRDAPAQGGFFFRLKASASRVCTLYFQKAVIRSVAFPLSAILNNRAATLPPLAVQTLPARIFRLYWFNYRNFK
jgi:hypothetical protein